MADGSDEAAPESAASLPARREEIPDPNMTLLDAAANAARIFVKEEIAKERKKTAAATDKKVGAAEERLNGRIDEVGQKLDGFAESQLNFGQQMSARVDNLTQRLVGVEKTLHHPQYTLQGLTRRALRVMRQEEPETADETKTPPASPANPE